MVVNRQSLVYNKQTKVWSSEEGAEDGDCISSPSLMSACDSTENSCIMTTTPPAAAAAADLNVDVDMATKEHPVVQLGFCVPVESVGQWKATGHFSSDHWYELWDGGQVGGRPTWLQPLPDNNTIRWTCRNPDCVSTNATPSLSLRFLCQLYAPIDELPPYQVVPKEEEEDETKEWKMKGAAFSTTTDRAYHRTLYLFGCLDCGHVRVLRTQLPRYNAYYSAPPATEDEDGISKAPRRSTTSPREQNSEPQPLCAVCGQEGRYRCPKQGVYFCGASHQKEYSRYVYKPRQQSQQNDDSAAAASNEHTQGEESQFRSYMEECQALPSIYPLWQLVVEEEPDPDDSDNDESPDAGEAVDSKTNNERLTRNTLFPSSLLDEVNDPDHDLEQEDLNRLVHGESAAEAASNEPDPVVDSFFDRIQSRPTQCLRYCRWPPSSSIERCGPLWMQRKYQLPQQLANAGKDGTVDPLVCPYCQGRREFEFQLQPQLLHYLSQDSSNTDNQRKKKNGSRKKKQDASSEKVVPEWGIVVVYTCTNSCDTNAVLDPELGAYSTLR